MSFNHQLKRFCSGSLYQTSGSPHCWVHKK